MEEIEHGFQGKQTREKMGKNLKAPAKKKKERGK